MHDNENVPFSVPADKAALSSVRIRTISSVSFFFNNSNNLSSVRVIGLSFDFPTRSIHEANSAACCKK